VLESAGSFLPATLKQAKFHALSEDEKIYKNPSPFFRLSNFCLVFRRKPEMLAHC